MLDFDNLVLAACQAAFGEQALYLSGAGAAATLDIIFDDRFAEVKFEDGSEIVEVKPVANIRASALAALSLPLPCQGELLRIRGRLYVIVQPPENDTMGDVRLTLRLASDAEAARIPTPPIPA